MALRTALANQFGIVDEVTYGVPVAPSRFYPIITETLEQRIARMESEAQLAGRQVMDSTQWAPGAIACGGNVGTQLWDRGLGLLMKHIMGGAAISGAGPYTQTYTPGDLAGLSFTAQKGMAGTDGTVYPLTYAGCKVASAEFASAEGAFATLGVDVLAKAEYGHRTVSDAATTNASAVLTSATGAFTESDIGSPISGTGIPASTRILSVESSTSVTMTANATATAAGVSVTIGMALAAVSYTASQIAFRYQKSTATIAGAAQKVKSWRLAIDNKLVERRFDGQPHTDEPVTEGLRDFTGQLEIEWAGRTQYDRFISGAEMALVLALSAGANKTWTATCNVRFDGETPKTPGRGIVPQMVPFKCVGTTDANALTVVTVNSDAAA